MNHIQRAGTHRLLRTCSLLLMGFGLWAAVVLVAVQATVANVYFTEYGDNDGFGIGAVSGQLLGPGMSHAGVGEAPFTDVRLIGSDPFYSAPGFTPTGEFNFFSIPAGQSIVSASLTLRTGAFDNELVTTSVNSLPNKLLLDGQAIPTSFFNLFLLNNGLETDSTDNFIETRSMFLPSTFFPLLKDGHVSLAGTDISEALGSGSFQVDFARLEITTVPEPCALSLGGLALAWAFSNRRKTTAHRRRRHTH